MRQRRSIQRRQSAAQRGNRHQSWDEPELAVARGERGSAVAPRSASCVDNERHRLGAPHYGTVRVRALPSARNVGPPVGAERARANKDCRRRSVVGTSSCQAAWCPMPVLLYCQTVRRKQREREQGKKGRCKSVREREYETAGGRLCQLHFFAGEARATAHRPSGPSERG